MMLILTKNARNQKSDVIGVKFGVVLQEISWFLFI